MIFWLTRLYEMNNQVGIFFMLFVEAQTKPTEILKEEEKNRDFWPSRDLMNDRFALFKLIYSPGVSTVGCGTRSRINPIYSCMRVGNRARK